MNFEELGLDKEMSARLVTHGIIAPTFIQKEVFPVLRAGESVVALSKTGTGKTLAYLAPLVQRYTYDLRTDDLSSKAWGLVLVPTRELADQAAKNLKLLTDNHLQSVVIVGGESEKNQISAGEKAALYVATPGRFLDLLKRRLVDATALKCVVFDEADRILDMGFIDDIRAIRRLLPKELQMCFFSATLHFGVDEMSYEFGVETQRIGQEQDEVTVEGLDHRVAFVGDQEKFHALMHFLKLRPAERGIVFTNYREKAHELVSRLKGLGVRADSLTAQLSQAQRTWSMQAFRDEKTQVLVASDLASRGLDVEGLDFVVNYDLPEDSATYVHRVGRTARAGKKGMALSLVGFDDSFRLERLEKFLGSSIVRFQFSPEQLQGPLPRLQGPKPAFESARPEGRAPAPHKQAPRPPQVQHVVAEKKVSAPAAPPSAWSKFVQKVLGIFGLKTPSQKATSAVTHKNDGQHSRSEESGQRRPYQGNRPRQSGANAGRGGRRTQGGPRKHSAGSSRPGAARSGGSRRGPRNSGS